MTVKLAEPAIEQSTYIIQISFKDEAGEPVVPKAAAWTLADKTGTAINSRSDVAISSLAATVTIVLTGNDLAMTTDKDRYVLVEAVYDSATYGNDLNLREEFQFKITELLTLT